MQQSVNNCNTATTYILYFWIHLFIMSHPQLSSLLLLFIAVRRSWQDIAVSCLIRLFLMKCEHLFVFRPDSLDIVTELKLLLYYSLLNKFSPLFWGILMIFSEGILHYVRSFWVPGMVGHPETTTSLFFTCMVPIGQQSTLKWLLCQMMLFFPIACRLRNMQTYTN